MEQGGMHKHTQFYIIEVLLGLVLVGVVILFYIWTTSLNDQIAALEMERVDLQGQLTEASEEREEPAEGVSAIQFAGKTLRLVPDRHEIELNGVRIGLIEGRTGLPGIDLSFMKTTSDQILGIRWQDAGGLLTAVEDYFVDPNSQEVVFQSWPHFDPMDHELLLKFGDHSYSLTPILSSTERCDGSKVESPADCNELYPVSLLGFALNGTPFYTFEPIPLVHGFHAEGQSLTPDPYIEFHGLSPGFDRAYFSILDQFESLQQEWSIDKDGVVERAALPDDAVTITDEVYE